MKHYAVVTGAYWVFTLSDGALRMMVLLYLHQLGFTPLELATLFVGYELAGVVTNATGGLIGDRFGLKATLLLGLAFQVAVTALLGWRADALTVAIVVGLQALSGVAKDLTKMSAKSYVKLVVPKGDAVGLMRWVSVLTGSKNSLKGIGFFIGGLLLSTVGFREGNFAMAAALTTTLLVATFLLPKEHRPKTKGRLRALFSPDARFQWLAGARLFLFAARDVLFAVALPVYLADTLGWSHKFVGAFLALWVIGYGVVQAAAPRIINVQGGQPERRLTLLAWSLLLPIGAMVGAAQQGIAGPWVLAIGLGAFGILFALNSALHSFLVVHFAEPGRVALRVGLYYAANASGRLVGTLLSGLVYQSKGQGSEGFAACLIVAGGLSLVSGAVAIGTRNRAVSAI